MVSVRWRWGIGLICLGVATLAGGTELSGLVRLTDQGAAASRVNGVIVYFRPNRPIELPAEPPREFVMSTRYKDFEPAVLAIPVGSVVHFPNRDPILHNVFSVSGDNGFDLGLYGEGEGSSRRFDQVGLVRVYCNVHQSMIGHILVLDTPFFAEVAENGEFSFSGVPEGPGRVYLWHERARPKAVAVELPQAEPLTLELALTKRKVPDHKNKYGKSYRDRRRQRGRY